MKNKKVLAMLSVLALSAPLTSVADTGWYAGAGGGRTNFNGNELHLEPTNLANETYILNNLDDASTGWKLFAGIIGILAGLVIIQHPLWASFFVPTVSIFVLGIYGLIIGIVELIQAFKGGGWGIGVLGVLSIIFGLILLANPFIGALALPWVLGIFGIIGGVFALVAAFRMR